MQPPKKRKPLGIVKACRWFKRELFPHKSLHTQLRGGPALPPRSMGGSVALGVGAGVGACGRLVGTGGGGGPERALIFLSRSGARGASGARTYMGTWIPGGTLPRGWVGAYGCGGSAASAGPGETLGAGMGVRAPLAALGVAPARVGGLACGSGVRVWVVWQRGASRLCRGAFRHGGGGGGVGDCGGAWCQALLLPGPWWQGLEVVDNVRGGLGLRCRLVAQLGLGLGFGGGPTAWCGGGLGLLLGGGLGWRLSFGLWRGGGFGPWCGGGFGLLLGGGLQWRLSFGLRRGSGFGLRLSCGCGLCRAALPPRFAGSGSWRCRGLCGGGGAGGGDAFWGSHGRRCPRSWGWCAG